MLHGRYDCRWAARINVRKRVALGRVNVRKRRVCERGSIRAETVTVAKILLPPVVHLPVVATLTVVEIWQSWVVRGALGGPEQGRSWPDTIGPPVSL